MIVLTYKLWVVYYITKESLHYRYPTLLIGTSTASAILEANMLPFDGSVEIFKVKPAKRWFSPIITTL